MQIFMDCPYSLDAAKIWPSIVAVITSVLQFLRPPNSWNIYRILVVVQRKEYRHLGNKVVAELIYCSQFEGQESSN